MKASPPNSSHSSKNPTRARTAAWRSGRTAVVADHLQAENELAQRGRPTRLDCDRDHQDHCGKGEHDRVCHRLVVVVEADGGDQQPGQQQDDQAGSQRVQQPGAGAGDHRRRAHLERYAFAGEDFVRHRSRLAVGRDKIACGPPRGRAHGAAPASIAWRVDSRAGGGVRSSTPR